LTKEQALALAKARRRKAESSAVSVPNRPAQATPLARELRTQPERAQYTREMAAQAFGDRPRSDEYLQAGLFGTTPLRPSQLPSSPDFVQPDWRQSEPGLQPAFMPEALAGLGIATAQRGARNIGQSLASRGKGIAARKAAASRDPWDELATPYWNRKQQIKAEMRGTDKSLAGTYKFRLSEGEEAVKKALKTVDGIDPVKKNLRDNILALNNGLRKSGQNLQTKLAKSKAVITEAELENALRRQFKTYSQSLEGLEFSGKDEIVDAAIDRVLTAYRQNKSNPSGLWDTRKAIDQVYQRLNGSRRYQAVVGNVDLKPTDAELIWDNSRKAMLELLEQKAPGSRNDMRRLSLLYDARQTMAEKAPEIGKTLYERAAKKLPLVGDKPISLKPRNWLQ